MATTILPLANQNAHQAEAVSQTAVQAAKAIYDVEYYKSLNSKQRAANAFDMACEMGQHYDRARSLLMVLAARLRESQEENDADPTTLNLAEIAEAWLHEPSHLAQENRLMACLKAASEVSHA